MRTSHDETDAICGEAGARFRRRGLRNGVLARGIPTAALADAQLPDFGQAAIVPIAGAIGSILMASYAYLRRRPWEEIEKALLVGGFVGGGALGLGVYAALLTIEGVR